MRGKSILERNGIRAFVSRTVDDNGNNGCGYSVIVTADFERAERLLRSAGIRIRGSAEGRGCTMTTNPTRDTVYFDNAATTWPKPASVREAVQKALTVYGANPGRSGYAMSIAASEAVYHCREAAASFFHMQNPGNVIFVQNCTLAMNMVLKGILRNGGRVIVSDLEHNAVMRPLHALSPGLPIYDVAQVTPGDTEATVSAFKHCIRPDTKAIVCLHASNVFGVRLPIRELGALAHRYGLLFVVDGAQSAGVLPIDMQQDQIDFLCVPGHKGLYGPMGIGMLLCNNDVLLPSFIEGGTGSQSLELTQPDELPDHLESGTLNTPGICGLKAGIAFVQNRGITEIAQRETALMARAYRQLERWKGIQLYTPCPDIVNSTPVLAINIVGRTSEDTARSLSRRGIAVRAGLQCAPCAHRHFGTLDTGVVRLSPSAFTTAQDIDYLCRAIRHEMP